MEADRRGWSAGCWSRGDVVGHFQEVEDAARVPGQIAHGLGDGAPAPLDETDSEAPQPGHGLWTVPGAAAVLVDAPVENVVPSWQFFSTDRA